MGDLSDNFDLFGDLPEQVTQPEYETTATVNDAPKPRKKTKAAIKDELTKELRVMEAKGEQAADVPDYETLDIVVALEHRPRYVVRDEWTQTYGRPGVWHHGLKIGVESIVPVDTFICTPLHVLAITRDDNSRNFGRLLRMKDRLNKWKEWAMPMAMLSGDGIELRSVLLDMGAEPDPDAKSSLLRYLQSQHPKREVLAATKLGWHGGGYLMPDRYFAPANDEIDAVLQDGALHASGLFERRGVLASWIDGVAVYAPGNPLLTLTLSTAFAAPLRHRVPGVLNGGFHISGETSTGKTTVINAAASVWGSPEKGKQVGTWRATGKPCKIRGESKRAFYVLLSDITKSPVTAVTANGNNNLPGYESPLPSVTAVTNPAITSAAPAKGYGGYGSNGTPVTDNILVNQCGYEVTAVTGEISGAEQNHVSDLADDEPDFEVF